MGAGRGSGWWSGGLPFAQILEWFTQASDALEHMHAANLMHRDLRAANVFLFKSVEDFERTLDAAA